MRPRLVFAFVTLIVTALGGACTSFGYDSPLPAGDAAVIDDAASIGTVPTPPGTVDGGQPLPLADASADAIAPGWGAAFVSTATTTGSLGLKQTTADRLCTTEGTAFRPGAKFAALLYRNDADTLFSRAGSSGPRYLPKGDGSQGALAITDVAAVGGTFAVRAHADGGLVSPGSFVWTGARGDGGTLVNCLGDAGPWTAGNSSFAGTTGDPRGTGSSPMHVGASTCDQTERLYCVEVGNFR